MATANQINGDIAKISRSELSPAEIERHRAEAAERRAARVARLFWNAKCPDRHVVNLDSIDVGQNQGWTATRDLIVEQAGYANGFTLALLGKRGVGKTQLCVSAMQRCCQRLMTARYTKAADLFRDVRRAYVQPGRGEAGVSEAEIVKEWAAYDLLVIDESHQRGETIAENNLLVSLLDTRYDGRRCTVLIANQTKAEFAAAVGDSVVSRIHETGEAIICDWPSYRTRGEWKQSADAPQRVPSGLTNLRTVYQ